MYKDSVKFYIFLSHRGTYNYRHIRSLESELSLPYYVANSDSYDIIEIYENWDSAFMSQTLLELGYVDRV